MNMHALVLFMCLYGTLTHTMQDFSIQQSTHPIEEFKKTLQYIMQHGQENFSLFQVPLEQQIFYAIDDFRETNNTLITPISEPTKQDNSQQIIFLNAKTESYQHSYRKQYVRRFPQGPSLLKIACINYAHKNNYIAYKKWGI